MTKTYLISQPQTDMRIFLAAENMDEVQMAIKDGIGVFPRVPLTAPLTKGWTATPQEGTICSIGNGVGISTAESPAHSFAKGRWFPLSAGDSFEAQGPDLIVAQRDGRNIEWR